MIIDTHVHIGDMLNFVLKKEDVISSMDRFGIDHSIVSSLNAAEFDHHLRPVPPKYQHSQLECLNDVVDFAKEYPNKISAAVWVRPFNEKAGYDLYKAINDNRKYIRAIKFHPYHSNMPFDGKETEPFIELAQHYGLPVVIHTGGCDAASCVYGDTTWVPVSSTLRLIEKAGIEKIMFGSDNPIDGPDTYLCNRTGDRSLYQQYFNELKEILSPDDYDRLMYKNASELFGINL